MINKITIPDIERKYKSGEINTSPINNYPIWRSETFTKEYSNRGIMKREEFIEWYEKNIMCLLEVRIKELKTIFGKQDFIFKNEYTWTVESNGCQAIIMSGNGKGTIVEIILNEKGRPKGSVNNFFFQYRDLMKFFHDNENFTLIDYEQFCKDVEFFYTTKKYNL